MIKDNETKVAAAFSSELKTKLDNGANLESLKEENDKLEYVPSDTKKLSGSFISLGKSDHIIGALLSASKDDLIGPIQTYRGFGLIKVISISPFDSTSWASQKDIVRIDLSRQKEIRAYQNWMTDLRDDANIVDNRKYHF